MTNFMKIPKSDRYGQHHDWDCGFQKNMWNYPSYHMHKFKALEKLINTLSKTNKTE